MAFTDCLHYEIPLSVSKAVWQALGDGEAFVTRKGGEPFQFATGQKATLKLDAERLDKHCAIINNLLGFYATHPCIQTAEALSFVPNGPCDFTQRLGQQLGKQVINLFRPDGASRKDICFRSILDMDLAQSIGSVCLVEDISRTGFSAHVTAAVLRTINPDLEIHSLSMLQREAVKSTYRQGPQSITYHTFVRQDIPLDVNQFRQQFPDIPVHLIS